MRTARTIRMVALLMIVTTAPLAAMALAPGVYKLKWNSGPASQDILWSRYRGYQAVISMSKPSDRVRGAASNRALISFNLDDSLRMCLDESKGTGKGYDTAYVGLGSEYDNDPDCRKMVRIPLVVRNGGLYAKGFAADVPLGARKAAPSRRVFDIVVRVQHDSRGEIAGRVWLYIRGSWQGRINTSKGSVPVRLVERQGFGQWQNVIIGRESSDEKDSGWSSPVALLHIGGAITFDNELYSLSVSPKGDSLSIQPYRGPTGVLSVRAVDGYGKPVSRASLSVGHLRFSCSRGRKIVMPVGNYTDVMFTLAEDARGRSITVDSGLPQLTIRKGVQTVKVGGPLAFDLQVDKSDDGTRWLNATPKLPSGQKLWDVPSNAWASLVIKDWRGRIVHSDANGTSAFSISFKLPKSLRPGSYTALVTFDARPYDKKRVFGAKLRVE
jgi:hypothetical protein